MAASLSELVTFWITAAPWLTMVWIAAVGGCIGSFLNVVVYRLPMGISLLHPGSRCPHCSHAIRAHDNIPVLSWLILRGRCRDCGATIAGRYPSIEASVALFFAIQWWVDVIGFSPASAGQPMLARQLVVFLLHVSLVCSLLAAALIDRDGHTVSWSIVWPLAVAVLLSCLLRLDALRSIRTFAGEEKALAGWQVLWGSALGSLFATICAGCGSNREGLALPALLGGIVGLVLGGFAAGVLIVVTSTLFWGLSRYRPWVTWPLLLTAATAAYQLTGNVGGLQFALPRTGWLSWVFLGLAVAWLGWLSCRRGNSAT